MKFLLTPLEHDVKKLYSSLGIRRPDQVDMMDIAEKLDIWIHEAPMVSRGRVYEGMASMVLDSRVTRPKQWEHFGHELGHILNHSGNQLDMPSSFREFQESKANNFALHFCVPTFMLLDSGIPFTWGEATLFVMETFNVTEEFARKRLTHFNRQVIGFEFYREFRRRVMANELNGII